MKQANIKVGTVYVGKCGRRFRLYERIDIFGKARLRCIKRYSSGHLSVDLAQGNMIAISQEAVARWAAREATAEETAEVMEVVEAMRRDRLWDTP